MNYYKFHRKKCRNMDERSKLNDKNMIFFDKNQKPAKLIYLPECFCLARKSLSIRSDPFID